MTIALSSEEQLLEKEEEDEDEDEDDENNVSDGFKVPQGDHPAGAQLDQLNGKQ